MHFIHNCWLADRSLQIEGGGIVDEESTKGLNNKITTTRCSELFATNCGWENLPNTPTLIPFASEHTWTKI